MLCTLSKDIGLDKRSHIGCDCCCCCCNDTPTDEDKLCWPDDEEVFKLDDDG